VNSYLSAMSRYFDFQGRSTRSEFWFFNLTLFVLLFLALFLDIALSGGWSSTEEPGGLVTLLVMIIHTIPYVSVSVRRLHDADQSGALVLLNLLPLIGFIILLGYHCTPSTPGSNRFGPHPLAEVPRRAAGDPYAALQASYPHQRQAGDRQHAPAPGPASYPYPPNGHVQPVAAPPHRENGFGQPMHPAHPAPTHGAVPAPDPLLDKLERLASLRSSGVIDDAEFSSMKADLLKRSVG